MSRRPWSIKHMALENILHAAPNALGNFFNDYNADTGTIVGGFGLMNFANPTWVGNNPFRFPFRAAAQIGAIENVTAVESGKLCSLFLGPGLRMLSFNSSPIPDQPVHQKSIDPSKSPLQRTAAGTRRRGPEARTARDPARGVCLHRPAG